MNMPLTSYMPNSAALNWSTQSNTGWTPLGGLGSQAFQTPMPVPVQPTSAASPFMPSLQANQFAWNQTNLPQNTGAESWWQTPGLVGGIAQGIGALASAWNANRGLGLARDQFRFQKEAYNTNLANSIQSYNTSLEDRIRGRTSDYEGKEQDVQSYLNRHSLRRHGG